MQTNSFMSPEEGAFNAYFAALPQVSRFLTEVAAVSENAEKPDEHFWRCQEAFTKLVRSSFLTEVINAELHKLREYPAHVAYNANSTNWHLLARKDFSLIVKIFVPAPQRDEPILMATSAADFMLAVVGREPFVADLYETPDSHDSAVINRSERLIPKGRCEIKRGQVLRLRAGKDLFRLLPIQRPVHVCFLSGPLKCCLIQNFDEKTLSSVLGIAADVADTRLEISMAVLANIKNRASLPPLKEMLHHSAHFVRWAALQAIGKIDGQEALEPLKQALLDPHPHIRNAAQRSLNQLQK